MSVKPDATVHEVLAFLEARQAAGDSAVLITITGMEGGTPRAVGSVMGVASDGSAAGSISSGCLEAAVVSEGLEVLRRGKTRVVRFGADSPYLDIVLPCGGSIDVLFNPRPNQAALATALALLANREPVLIEQNRVTGEMHCGLASSASVTGWREEKFSVWCLPVLNLLIIGHGSHCLTLAGLALAYGAGVKLLSPDQSLLELARDLGASTGFLKTTDAVEQVVADRWTAIVFMFHDHDWEPVLLAQAMHQPAFMIGALGSRRTHARRTELLDGHGVASDLIACIEAPLGLIPLARDAKLLAISTLAQVADRFRGLRP